MSDKTLEEKAKAFSQQLTMARNMAKKLRELDSDTRRLVLQFVVDQFGLEVRPKENGKSA